MINKFFLMIALLISNFVFVAAQTAVFDESTAAGRQEAAIAREDARIRDNIKGRNDRRTIRDSISSPRISTSPASPRMTTKDREMISIDPEDMVQYESFLKLPDSGIVRLRDFDNCDQDKLYTVNVSNINCTWNVIGNASTFSFRKEKYSNFEYSDILFRDSAFEIHGVNLLSFLTDLGDKPLESLTLESEGIKPLAEFQAAKNANEFAKKVDAVKNGFKIGKFDYTNRQLVNLNSTYAIRSIAYKFDGNKNFRNKMRRRYGKDNRKDIVAIFKVIRNHDDGSISVLWRKLSENSVPKIKK